MKERMSRQTFLGNDFESILENAWVGIVGLGGGGSHIVQQLAHIGFKRYVLFDGDSVEESNLNRLVGATQNDASKSMQKVTVAVRQIEGLVGGATIQAFSCRWQENPAALAQCNLIFGCVDSFAERSELEAHARRYLASYIDIGMDVHSGDDRKPVMGGQVIASIPGGPCMRCLGFLTEERLGIEGRAYGNVGIKPQVVWANGILASTAVGVGVDLLSNWTGTGDRTVYLSMDANRLVVSPHWRVRSISSGQCPHYPADAVGSPVFSPL